MASYHRQTAFYAAHPSEDAKGATMAAAAACPQCPCDADSGVHDIHVAMIAMSVDGDGGDELPAKENVRPNHGRRNKWRKNRRVAVAVAPDRDECARETRRDPAKQAPPPEEEGRRDDPESKKAVVVEISRREQQRRPPAARHSILPPIDLDAAAAETEDTSSPASSNETSSSSRHKKTKYKGRRYPLRRKPKSKRAGAVAGVEHYAPNGQYPYAMAPDAADLADPAYVAGLSPPHGPRGDFYHQAFPYDQSSGAGVAHGYAPYQYQAPYHTHTYQCAQYPCPAAVASPDAHTHGVTHVAPANGGYYLPVIMAHSGAGHYDPRHAPSSPGAGYPPYDHYDVSGYAAFGGMMCRQLSPPCPREPSGAAAGRALNIDAPAFSPKEKCE